MEREVRVRFAPSPTGPLHIGGVRTALYNYLFAKRHKGTFILRIEDTDQGRWVPGAENYIIDSLNWLGILPDEGPVNGGSFGPYRQSERSAIYAKYAEELILKGMAYFAFDTSEEIESMKSDMEAAGDVKPQYNSISRLNMKNSLTLSAEEVKQRIAKGEPYVVRIKMPSEHEIKFKDTVRDLVVVNSSTLDDKVLLKSDGMPTYHLANVVDDHLMEISHVIRGEEWLPSAPLHVFMYECFGWQDTIPLFAHLPLIMKPDGKGKLSKRDSKKHGFPIFPMEWTDADGDQSIGFREEGYLPEALLNFLAFLGWNPGGERELFDLNELSNEFSLERITKGGARFDVDKSKWFNQQYIHRMSDHKLAEYILNDAKIAGIGCSVEQAERVAALMKERVTFPKELFYHAMYLFKRPESYDMQVATKKWTAEAVRVFGDFSLELSKSSIFSSQEFKNTLENILLRHEMGMGKVMQALRLAVTGIGGGPDLMEIMSFLGPKEVAQRIDRAIEEIKTV